ncbi:MAG: DUF2275 domain-containing protein [Nitrospirae bacterium]|nr:DUF2275 domain-containing protein [Nitrospirota bacterium]
MECNKVQEKLSALIDGILSQDEKMLVEKHLKSCEKCREALSELKKTIGHIKNQEEIEPPAWLTQKVMAKIKAEAAPKKGLFEKLFYPLRIKLPVGAVATIAIAVTTIYIFKSIQPEIQLAKAPSEEIIERKVQPPVIARDEVTKQSQQTAAEPKISKDKADSYLTKKEVLQAERDKAYVSGEGTPITGKPSEQPMPAKEPESMKFAATKGPAPVMKEDKAMPSAGIGVMDGIKREAAPTPKSKAMADKKEIDFWITYKNELVKIEFLYPANYTYKVGNEKLGASSCDFSLTFMSKQDTDYYSLLKVILIKSNFEQAAKDNYFQKEDGKWVVVGRHGMTTEATPIRGKNWRGLKGETFVGAHNEKGYSGLQEVLKIFAMIENNSDCSVVFYSEGMPEEIFYKILSSFKFNNQ